MDSAQHSPTKSARDDELKKLSLGEVADQLEASGQDPGRLRELQAEMNCLERPPGFFTRLTQEARDAATKHWGFVLGELHESKEAAAILGRVVSSSEEVSLEDRDKLKTQMLDLLRAVPAGLLAAANAALPIPCTSLATPWLLHRLGVMPSHWREAHLLSSLQTEVGRLRSSGCDEQAAALEAIASNIEVEAVAREQVERDAQLLTHWDANDNGSWDDEERAAYRAAVAVLARRAERSSARRSWYLLHEGGVFGPVRLSNFIQEDHPRELLVCWEGKSGWVALVDILARSSPAVPSP